jgi:hypothetical protein
VTHHLGDAPASALKTGGARGLLALSGPAAGLAAGLGDAAGTPAQQDLGALVLTAKATPCLLYTSPSPRD